MYSHGVKVYVVAHGLLDGLVWCDVAKGPKGQTVSYLQVWK